jgi:uncharacterized protein DUF4388
MSLTGNLRTMDLPEILQWISTGRKTGTLHVERRSVHKRIVFKTGVIHSSTSNDPRESMGQFLIRDRRVTEEQLFRALLRQETEGRLLGAILVGDGVLNEEALRKSLESKAEETIYDLFLWEEGKFEFKDGELPDNILVHVNMGVTSVIMEGIRRVDEWRRIKEVFPSMATTFRANSTGMELEDAAERQAVTLAGGGKTLSEMSLEMRRSEFETASLVLDLHNRGLLAVDRVKEEIPDDAVGSIQDLLSAARQRITERRWDAANQAFEKVLALDHLNQDAKKGLISVAEARKKDRILRTVPLDNVPVLKMDVLSLTRQNFDAREGFVLSRVNGEWDVRSILKLCPMAEEDALLIFARLLERKVIELRKH